MSVMFQIVACAFCVDDERLQQQVFGSEGSGVLFRNLQDASLDLLPIEGDLGVQ